MKKKIFAFSDVHGEYTVLINSLKKAGFDENNPDHLLISLGDEFDRGTQSLDVYKYLKDMEEKGKAIIIQGNHSKFFIEYLDGTSYSPFNYINNGTRETLADFLGRTAPFESWCFLDKGIEQPTYGDFAEWIKEAREEINENFPELLNWLKTRPYYYETKNYIFVHGAIDTKTINWKEPHCILYNLRDWDALNFNDGTFFNEQIINTDKTVVIGHFATSQLRKKYPHLTTKDKGEEFDVLERDDGRIIALDATTNYSKRINIFIIEDEIIN